MQTKTEYMCFSRGAISTLSGSPLKLADKFTYLGIIVSSTESDVSMRLAKTWIGYRLAIDYVEIWSIR